MFTHIMVPYDLAAKDTLAKSVKVAGDLARSYGAKLTLVSVAGGINSVISNSAEEYARQLEAHAAQLEQLEKTGINSKVYESSDPSADVDHMLIEAIDDLKVDLVVMATHKPGWIEYLVNSRGGRMARHAGISVFVVRD